MPAIVIELALCIWLCDYWWQVFCVVRRIPRACLDWLNSIGDVDWQRVEVLMPLLYKEFFYCSSCHWKRKVVDKTLLRFFFGSQINFRLYSYLNGIETQSRHSSLTTPSVQPLSHKFYDNTPNHLCAVCFFNKPSPWLWQCGNGHLALYVLTIIFFWRRRVSIVQRI